MKLKQKLYNLLRWSQKYTKTDMVYLAKGGSWLTLEQIFLSLSSLLLLIAFANLLAKETYGIYRYVLSVANILLISSLGGINTAIIRAVAKRKESSIFPGLRTRISWGILGGIVSLGLSLYYYLNGNNTLALSFLIAAPFLPFFDSFSLYRSLFIGRKRFDLAVKFKVIVQLISVGALILTLFLTRNLFLTILVYFASYTFLRMLFTLITIKRYCPNEGVEVGAISYGKHLSLMDIISTVAKYFDQILVFHYLGSLELAIYSLAISPPGQISSLLSKVQTLALPKFAQADKKDIKLNLGKKMLKFTILIAGIIIIYILFAPLIYKLIFPRYLESVFYTKIFAISLITGVGTLPLSFLQAKKEVKSLYKFNFLSAFFRIGILLIGVNFGLIGIILARVVGRFVNLCYLIILSKES